MFLLLGCWVVETYETWAHERKQEVLQLTGNLDFLVGHLKAWGNCLRGAWSKEVGKTSEGWFLPALNLVGIQALFPLRRTWSS